jgi:hypothetical protein
MSSIPLVGLMKSVGLMKRHRETVQTCMKQYEGKVHSEVLKVLPCMTAEELKNLERLLIEFRQAQTQPRVHSVLASLFVSFVLFCTIPCVNFFHQMLVLHDVLRERV